MGFRPMERKTKTHGMINIRLLHVESLISLLFSFQYHIANEGVFERVIMSDTVY